MVFILLKYLSVVSCRPLSIDFYERLRTCLFPKSFIECSVASEIYVRCRRHIIVHCEEEKDNTMFSKGLILTKTMTILMLKFVLSCFRQFRWFAYYLLA